MESRYVFTNSTNTHGPATYRSKRAATQWTPSASNATWKKKQNQNQPNSKIVKKKTHLYVPEPHVVAALAQDPPSHVYITITILMKA